MCERKFQESYDNMIKERETLKEKAFLKLDEYIKDSKHQISPENIYAGKKLIETFLNPEYLDYKIIEIVDVEIKDGNYSKYDGYTGDINIIFGEKEYNDNVDYMLYFNINTQYEVGESFKGILGKDNLNTFMVYIGYVNSIHDQK